MFRPLEPDALVDTNDGIGSSIGVEGSELELLNVAMLPPSLSRLDLDAVDGISVEGVLGVLLVPTGLIEGEVDALLEVSGGRGNVLEPELMVRDKPDCCSRGRRCGLFPTDPTPWL